MVAQPGQTNVLQSIINVIGFLLYAFVTIVKAIYNTFLPKAYQKLKNIDGEIALVTGGGSGLGRLLALRLAKLGATVVLWDISTEGLEESVSLVKGLGGKVFAFRCDVADKDDVYRVAKKTQQEVGDVTILINNAGVVSGQLLLNTPDHLIKRTFDVNILAHFWTVKAFLPKMIEKDHGHIVTIASMAGFVGVSKLVDYCSSKYAAVGFDESLRSELEAQGIRGVKTTAICPYFIQQTGMFDNVSEKSRLIKRLKPNDVADRTIEALRKDETVVLVPGKMFTTVLLKLIMPWPLTSTVIQKMIPDAAPHSQPSPVVQIRESKDVTSEETNKTEIESLSSSVTQLNRRLVTAGKNL